MKLFPQKPKYKVVGGETFCADLNLNHCEELNIHFALFGNIYIYTVYIYISILTLPL